MNEHIHVDDARQFVDFYGISQDEVIGVRKRPTAAQSLSGGKGESIAEAETIGGQFHIPIQIENFAPDEASGDKADFFIRYTGYVNTHPMSNLKAIIKGQGTLDEFLRPAIEDHPQF